MGRPAAEKGRFWNIWGSEGGGGRVSEQSLQKGWTGVTFKPSVSANVPSLKANLAAIAAAAGVSPMTVSRALNGAPGVSKPLRRRLQALAGRMGYHRDGAAALLASRRSEGRGEFREYVALFIFHSQAEIQTSWTFSGFISGVQARAAELGYGICPVWLVDAPMRPSQLAAFLRARNIRGAVVSPDDFRMLPPEMHGVLGSLACAAMGGLPRIPAFHFACCDHFATAAIATARALALGYRRPGFAVLRRIDERSDRRFRGGFHSVQSELSARDLVPVCQLDAFEPAPLLEWFRKYRPDVIITHNRRIAVANWLAPLGVRVPRDLGWISLDVQPGDQGVTGVDQRSAVIGGAALDLVHAQLQRGEFGEPAVQKGVLIEGIWQEGESVRAQGKGASEKGKRKTLNAQRSAFNVERQRV